MAGVPFLVETRNIATGTVIMADKKYNIGTVNATNMISIKLNVAGVREIGIKIGDFWLSSTVSIAEQPKEDDNPVNN